MKTLPRPFLYVQHVKITITKTMPGKVSAGTKRKDPPAKKAESSDDDDSSEEEPVVAKKAVAVKAQPAAKGKAPAKKVSILIAINCRSDCIFDCNYAVLNVLISYLH